MVPGWTHDGSVIKKTFSFKNFKEALVFFNEVAKLADQEDHHPDMGIRGWKYVDMAFSTHAVKGLTENDFIMAAKVEALRI